MAKANKNSRYFTRRGETKTSFDFDGEKIEITVNIPTNYQHNTMMEEFTDISGTGEINIRGADLIEERLIQFLTELPFEIPYDENMETLGLWSEAGIEERRNAIRLMDPEMCEIINAVIIGKASLSGDELGN